MGPGESYMGLKWFCTARQLMVKDPEKIQEDTYKGDEPVYDIMPRNYGVCDICQEFDDAVYIMTPATVNTN